MNRVPTDVPGLRGCSGGVLANSGLSDSAHRFIMGIFYHTLPGLVTNDPLMNFDGRIEEWRPLHADSGAERTRA